MPGYYQLNKSAPNQYGFTLHAENGRIILTSEPYTSRAAAAAGIEACQENSPFDYRYLYLISVKGEPYFALTAQNGRIIGTSEMYHSIVEREGGAQAVKNNGATFVVKEGAHA